MIELKGSVGRNGINNAEDVALVRARLVELGFDWIKSDTNVGPKLISVIQLFQSIFRGQDVVGGTQIDGLIDVNGATIKWLNATNAPRWMRMTAKGTGFINMEAQDHGDHHDFGTQWLDEVIIFAGQEYEAFRSAKNAAPLAINDASLPTGGNTPDHKGHETGLVCDLFLPKKNGEFGKTVTGAPEYDQLAMREQLRAFHRHPQLQVIFLNDKDLIAEGLCSPLDGHHNHAHVEIKPPLRS
jgi:hypothetical protein